MQLFHNVNYQEQMCAYSRCNHHISIQINDDVRISIHFLRCSHLTWQTGWSLHITEKHEIDRKTLTDTKATVRCQYTQGHDVNSDSPSFLLLQATRYRTDTYIAVVSCIQMQGNEHKLSASPIQRSRNRFNPNQLDPSPNRRTILTASAPNASVQPGAITLHCPA